MLVVAIDLFAKNGSDLSEFRDLLQGTGADNAILHPTVRPLDLALSLRRQGKDDVHAQQVHHLCIDIVCLKHMFAPETVPSLHKAEDTQRIYIVTKGQTECLDHSLCGLNMGPGGLGGEEIGEEQQAAVVVDGSDERPFLLGIWRSQMCGAVELDQGAGGAGKDLSIVGFARLVAAQSLGTINRLVFTDTVKPCLRRRSRNAE